MAKSITKAELITQLNAARAEISTLKTQLEAARAVQPAATKQLPDVFARAKAAAIKHRACTRITDDGLVEYKDRRTNNWVAA